MRTYGHEDRGGFHFKSVHTFRERARATLIISIYALGLRWRLTITIPRRVDTNETSENSYENDAHLNAPHRY